MLVKFKNWYKNLPDNKRYIEVLTAALSVPVLITVIINNVSNIQSRKQSENTPESETRETTFIPVEVEKEVVVTPEVTLTESQKEIIIEKECKKDLGPVTIASPKEGEVVSGNVTLDVVYEQGEYCGAVWSYRINSGSWSEYTDKSIVLVGLSGGEKQLELRVKSLAGGDEKLLLRSFYVDGPTPTPEKDATSSAYLQ